MSTALIYLLEVSFFLAILYGLYWLLLRNEHLFSANRFLLLFSLALAFSIPFISISETSFANENRAIDQLTDARNSYYLALDEWVSMNGNEINSSGVEKELAWSWFEVLTLIYLGGVLACFGRLLLVLAKLSRIYRNGKKKIIDGISVILTNNAHSPFSFLNTLFVNSHSYHESEFKDIMAHERTHIRQWHSIDLIIVQLAACILWFNPIVWWLHKSIKQTHEYIADSKMIKKGYSLDDYQSLLLRQLISNHSIELVHHFNLSFIKKRITMLQNEKSRRTGAVKVALTIIITISISVLVISCNSRTEERDDAYELTEVQASVVSRDARSVNVERVVEIGISQHQLFLNDRKASMEEIEKTVLDKVSLDDAAIIKMESGGKMNNLKELFLMFKRTNRRKIIFLGKTDSGQEMRMPFFLPPLSMSAQDLLAQRESIDEDSRMNIDLGASQLNLENRTADFVYSQIDQGISDFVVCGNYSADTEYQTFLNNLTDLNRAFDKVYEKRAQEMFNETFSELTKDQNREVRSGIPRAISVLRMD